MHLVHYVVPFPEHSRQDPQFKAKSNRHIAGFYGYAAKHLKHVIPPHSRKKNKIINTRGKEFQSRRELKRFLGE